MTLDRPAVQDALQACYENITAVTGALGDDELMLPTRCTGWAVGDVLYHQLLDARRALVTLATPAADGQWPDINDITYWQPFSPRSGMAASLGSRGAARHARQVRIAASAYPPGALASEWRETAAAACRAARACRYPAVCTQGHVLATADFLATRGWPGPRASTTGAPRRRTRCSGREQRAVTA